MAKRGYKSEAQRKKMLESEDYHTTRNSGSIGASDLIAVKFCKKTQKFKVRYEQVKKTRKETKKGKVFYFNERSLSELRRLKEINETFNIPCFFTIKYTYGGWICIPVQKIKGNPIYLKENKGYGI